MTIRGFSLEGTTPCFESKPQHVLKLQYFKPDIWKPPLSFYEVAETYLQERHTQLTWMLGTLQWKVKACDQSPREPVRLVLSQCHISAFSLRQLSGGIKTINQKGHQAWAWRLSNKTPILSPGKDLKAHGESVARFSHEHSHRLQGVIQCIAIFFSLWRDNRFKI